MILIYSRINVFFLIFRILNRIRRIQIMTKTNVQLFSQILLKKSFTELSEDSIISYHKHFAYITFTQFTTSEICQQQINVHLNSYFFQYSGKYTGDTAFITSSSRYIDT